MEALLRKKNSKFLVIYRKAKVIQKHSLKSAFMQWQLSGNCSQQRHSNFNKTKTLP